MDESEGQIVNFERICRLCLHEERTLTDIFEPTTDNNNFSIDQKIMACATIDLAKGDGLPSRICIKCLTSVNAAFDFRVQCENADKTLHILHNLVTSETDKVKSDKIINPVGAIVDEEDEAGEEEEVEQTERETEKDKENLEQIILIKKEDSDAKIDEDHGDLYYIVKDSGGDFIEGILSDTEIVYYDNGSNSGVSTADSIEGKVMVEAEDEEEEFEEDDEDVVGEEMADGGKELLQEEVEGQKVSFEVKKIGFGENRFELLMNPATEGLTLKEAQAKSFRRTGADDVQKSPCPFCNKMLTRVDEHIRLMHRNKVYICNKFDCGAQFATLKNLQSHQLTCYDVEKAYKCPYCFKEFHRKSNYKAHVRRHNSKKEFQCQLCDSAFVDTTGLRRHFLKHHEPEREIFVSNCCGKRFKSKEGLKKHINRRICGIEVLQVVDPSPIEVPM